MAAQMAEQLQERLTMTQDSLSEVDSQQLLGTSLQC